MQAVSVKEGGGAGFERLRHAQASFCLAVALSPLVGGAFGSGGRTAGMYKLAA